MAIDEPFHILAHLNREIDKLDGITRELYVSIKDIARISFPLGHEENDKMLPMLEWRPRT